MLFLALNGSPNRNGNTAQMLHAALEVVSASGEEGVFIHVPEVMSGVKVPFCLACSDPCQGKCYQGTALEEVFNLMRRADGIFVGSPVYFCTVSAQLKGFWDKMRSLRRERALLNVVGAALSVGGARFGGQETTLRAIQDMMLCQGMTVVGDGHWEEDAGHQGACAQRPVAGNVEALKRCRILAQRVLELARATQGLRRRK